MNTTAKIGAKRTFEENIDEVTRIIEGPLRILPREVRKCNPRPNHKGSNVIYTYVSLDSSMKMKYTFQHRFLYVYEVTRIF